MFECNKLEKSVWSKYLLYSYSSAGVYFQQITLKKLKAALPMYFAKLGSVEEAHTFCQELALKKVSNTL